MLVQQLVHQLNNTELGRTGTHDCYVYICKETVPTLTFLETGKRYSFVYKRNTSVVGELFYTHTSTGEYRISGCKPFFDAGEANAGDCIVIERSGDNFWVDFIKRENIIVFNRLNDKWQCRNEERLYAYLNKQVQAFFLGEMGILSVKCTGKIAKRTQLVNAYVLTFNGHEIVTGDIYNLLSIGQVSCLTQVFKDRVSSIEWSDYE